MTARCPFGKHWPVCPCGSKDVWMGHNLQTDAFRLHCHTCGKVGERTSWNKPQWSKP